MKFFNIFKRKRKPRAKIPNDRRVVWVIVILLIIAGYLIYIFSRSVWRNYEVNRQVMELNMKIEDLTVKQDYLKNLVAYYETKSFAEKEARSKLGMKKEGETVLALPRKGALDTSGEQSIEEPVVDKRSNFTKWWQFFFSK
jgi:cell division protein FtsB